jgi:hypothetical protein
MTQDEAKRGILALWMKRPADKRTGNDVLILYGELATADSALLSFKFAGDKYQCLAAWLRPHLIEGPNP